MKYYTIHAAKSVVALLEKLSCGTIALALYKCGTPQVVYETKRETADTN